MKTVDEGEKRCYIIYCQHVLDLYQISLASISKTLEYLRNII